MTGWITLREATEAIVASRRAAPVLRDLAELARTSTAFQPPKPATGENR